MVDTFRDSHKVPFRVMGHSCKDCIQQSLYFYAPVSKDRGHVVLPLSVCPSAHLSVRLSVYLSTQT